MELEQRTNEAAVADHQRTTRPRVTRANRNQKMKGRSWVYFAQLASGPVKIGQSRQVPQRMKALQTAHHEEVRLIGLLPEQDVTEHEVQSKFARFRIRGEWFSPAPQILELAAAGLTIYANGYVHIIPDEHAEQFGIVLSARPVRGMSA
jgi:hypothetical protein